MYKAMKGLSNHNIYGSIQNELANRIKKACEVEMIFLLGSRYCHSCSESIFHADVKNNEQMVQCFLLVLVPEHCSKELHRLEEKIEGSCSALMTVTALVITSSLFKAWLGECHRFACRVRSSALLIFDSGSCELPPVPDENFIVKKSSERMFDEGLMKAREFLAGSELFRVRKQHAMAAFMLHQSAEQTLRALVNAVTGYHVNTHSIDRLLRFAVLVSFDVPLVFPQHTEEEKRLFQFLQKAYIHTRYKDDYAISHADLLVLTERVKRINELVWEERKVLKNRSLPQAFK